MLNSASEMCGRAGTDAKADCGPAFQELTILEGFKGDIFQL